MRLKMPLWRRLVPLLLLVLHPSLTFRRLVAEFSREERGAGPGRPTLNLSSLVLDPGTGRLYVAGTNVIYQLDLSLRMQQSVETGKNAMQICLLYILSPSVADP
jgi:hypothetical protein